MNHILCRSKCIEAGSILRVRHVQERGKPRTATDFKVNNVQKGSIVQVVDEKHDAVVRVGLSTSLSQTVAPLRTESRDRCPSVFLIGHIQLASDGTREDSVTVLPATALTRKTDHVFGTHYVSAPGDSGSPAFGLYVPKQGRAELLHPELYHWGWSGPECILVRRTPAKFWREWYGTAKESTPSEEATSSS